MYCAGHTVFTVHSLYCPAYSGYARSWDASQRLSRKLLLSLYDAAVAAGSSGASLDETLEAAGGVSDALVAAFRAILTDSAIDGATAAMTITLPSQSELIQVRCNDTERSLNRSGSGVCSMIHTA